MRDRVHQLWVRLGSRRAQLVAWVLAGLVVVVLLIRAEAAVDRSTRALNAFATAERRDDARQCENAWEVREGVRALIEGLVAASHPDPQVETAFRDDMNQRLPDPDCDLARARRVLDDE